MTKTILTLSTALVLAVGAFASAAEAGSCGGGGYRSSGSSYRAAPAKRAYSVRTSKPRVVAQSSSTSRKTAVAAAEREVRRGAPVTTSVAALADKAVPLAEPAVAALDAADETTETAARDLGCRRFIPAAGLTISVACGE